MVCCDYNSVYQKRKETISQNVKLRIIYCYSNQEDDMGMENGTHGKH